MSIIKEIFLLAPELFGRFVVFVVHATIRKNTGWLSQSFVSLKSDGMESRMKEVLGESLEQK